MKTLKHKITHIRRNPEKSLSCIFSNKYPIDIILCMLWSIILLPIALLNVEGTIRIILSLPFILFIPGYIMIFALFPTRKTDGGIDTVERIALSFGLSIAIVPLIGLGLNYTPWGIRLVPILFSIFVFIIVGGCIAIYRWIKTDPDERFTVSFDLSIPKTENKLDKALTIILAASIIIAALSFVYIIVIPKTGEKFTEFYLLGSGGKAEGFPKNLTLGNNASVTIGLVNHEYKLVNYTIEIWLVNQTTIYNESTDENETVYNHMWFMDKITVMLNHTPTNIEEPWAPQWEYNCTFNINRSGSFKLAYLLYTTPTDNYSYDKDYKDIAKQKIDDSSSIAYRKTYLWVNVY